MPFPTLNFLSTIAPFEAPLSVVLADWLSTIPAEGSGSLPVSVLNSLRKI